MAVYYQTYRPQNFSEVVGQEPIVKALLQAAKLGRIGHAYLFCGSRGIGKTTLARILAKAANCTDLKNGDPCTKCSACTAISGGRFLDVVEIDAASHTGVDNIRELIERINFGPSLGLRKVFIIDEVHMLSKAAFNALLKTLEEPPAHALFILATTDIDKVPETIVSRTQRFDFRKITSTQILKTLETITKQEKLTLSPESLQLIAQNSEGGLRDALSQLSMIAVLEKNHSMDDVHLLLGTTSREIVDELLGYITAGQTEPLPQFFARQTEQNFDATSFTRKVLTVLQERLEAVLINEGSPDGLQLPQLLHITRLFLRAYKEIERALSPELPVLLASIEAALYMGGSSDNSSSTNQRGRTNSNRTNPAENQSAIRSAITSLPSLEVTTAVAIEQKLTSTQTDKVLPELTSEQVKLWWPALVNEVRGVNSPLATLLKNSPLADVSGNQVLVSVKYLFHKEQLESGKLRSVITDFLSEQAGGPVIFGAVINKGLAVDNEITDTATAVGDALRIFGGELIE